GTKEQCIVSTTNENYCNIPSYSAPWTQGKVVPQNHVGSVTFNDLQFRVKTPWNAQISVGANNVFDRQGPVMYTQPNSNFSYYGGYDIGRFW
ncbi:hypothetical protein MRO49_24845, partial [Escherichia coli]|uniref:hypothetical protein n=1 Tax=Escherichia coli TaxID=562 RepID=UPI00211592A6